MREQLEKYDKLITAALVIIAFVFGIGYWFAEEKSEPVYLSKIDKLMFDKDNKAPKFVLPLPDKLTAKEKNKTDDVVVDAGKVNIPHPTQIKEEAFSLEKLLADMPNLFNLPAKPATQTLNYIEQDDLLTETTADGKRLPKISEDERKPWSEYGKIVEVQPNFKKVAVVFSGLGFDTTAVNKIAEAFDSEVSMSFTPYTPKPRDVFIKSRETGHETYIDFLLPSKNYLKEDTGPLSINTNLSLENARNRFHETIAKPAPVGGIIVRDGTANENNKIVLSSLFMEAVSRGLLMIDATSGDGIDKITTKGLARKKADVVINKDMLKDDIEKALKKAEEIAFDKGQVLIVSDPKPIAVLAIYNWIQTFSPQVSYEEAKTVDISKPFALVPLSNLVVER